jgi:sugar phosphate isomerase/epimerase
MGIDRGHTAGVERAQVALSTGSLYTWALERVFALAAAAGYDGVELLVDARMDSYDVPYLRGLSERCRMPILSVHTPFVERLEGWPDAPEARVERTVRLAEALGARNVVAHAPLRWQVGRVQVALGGWRAERGFVLPWRSPAGARYARWLVEELPALQAQTPVQVALENMPMRRAWGRNLQLHHFSSIEELGRFPCLVLDTTHWGTCGVDPVKVYRALHERIVHVHLSNYDGREHRLPAKGALDLDALLVAMRQAGFSGLLVIEVEPRAVMDGDWSEARARRELEEACMHSRALLGLLPSHSQRSQVSPSTSVSCRQA